MHKRLDGIARIQDHYHVSNLGTKLSTTRQSKGTCTYIPTPPAQMALGADHDPSSRRATTTPVPALPDHNTPALTIVKMAILIVLDFLLTRSLSLTRVGESVCYPIR
jgi:hypothetical protein